MDRLGVEEDSCGCDIVLIQNNLQRGDTVRAVEQIGEARPGNTIGCVFYPVGFPLQLMARDKQWPRLRLQPHQPAAPLVF